MVGLVVDDAEELLYLRRVQREAARGTAAAEPLMAASGARSSWLTIPRNSARCRCRSSTGARSWRMTTKDSTSPVSARMGAALTRTLTRLPSGTWRAISSASSLSEKHGWRVFVGMMGPVH